MNEWQVLEKHHLHALIQIETSLTRDLMTWVVFYFNLLGEIFEKPVSLALLKMDRILFSSINRHMIDKRSVILYMGTPMSDMILVEMTHPMFRFKQLGGFKKEEEEDRYKSVQFTFYLTFTGPESIVRHTIEEANEKMRLLATESRRTGLKILSAHENRILFSCNTHMPAFIAFNNKQCHCIDCGLQPCEMSLAEMWH